MKTQFITNEQGKRIAAILPIAVYQKMLNDLEDLNDIRLYDQAKREDDGKRIPFGDYLKKRKEKNA